MNTALLLTIADLIELEPRSFHLAAWESECGTTRCIGGWALHLTDPEKFQELMTEGEVLRPAAAALGLTPEQAIGLFFAWPDSVWWRVADDFGWSQGRRLTGQIEGHQAAKVLRQIAHGEIEL